MNHPDQVRISGLGASARAAFQWRLLLLWSGAMLLPTALLTLPVWQFFGAALDHSVHAAALARRIDLLTATDLLGAHGRNAIAFNAAAIAALVLTLALSPLLTGMVLTAARGTRPGFGALLHGALGHYWRLARMLVWTVLPMAAALAAGAAILEAASKYQEQAILASHASTAGYAALALSALLVMAVHASIDSGRALLALERRRRSAVKAWWHGLRLLWRQPAKACGAYLLVTLAGALLLAVLGAVRVNVPQGGAAGLIGAFLLTQIIVMALAWMRATRLFVLIALAERTLPAKVGGPSAPARTGAQAPGAASASFANP